MAKILNMSDLLSDEIELIKNYRRSDEDAKASILQYSSERAEGPKGRTDLVGLTVPDDGLIHLQDLNFDFEAYFERGLEELSEAEREEFAARMYGLFCRDVFTCGGDMNRISLGAANYVAERLYQALGGVPWHDIMGLPWDEPTPFLTPVGQRMVMIGSTVEGTLKRDPSTNVTTLLAQQAEKHCVSYETARGDYYTWKKIQKDGKGLPTKFLNNPIED